jgi:ankyrin repeat protein
MLSALLGEGFDVNERGGDFDTPLQAASSSGSLKCIELLLDAGADVNMEGGVYGTALQAACFSGKTESVKLLLTAGANVNARGGKYESAFNASLENGSTIIEILLDHGASLEVEGDLQGVLSSVCKNGSASAICRLLDAGLDINEQNTDLSVDSSPTPLWAAVFGNTT